MSDQPQLGAAAFVQKPMRPKPLDEERIRAKCLENDARNWNCSQFFVPFPQEPMRPKSLDGKHFPQEPMRPKPLDEEQIRAERLENDARNWNYCQLFIPFLHILLFILAPAFAHQLASLHDPSYIPIKHPQRELHFQVQRYLVDLAMARNPSTLPPLDLPSDITRPQLWKGWLESIFEVIIKAKVSAPSLHFEPVSIPQIEDFLRSRRVSLPLPNVKYWYDILSRKLPLQSPFPALDLNTVVGGSALEE
jgi:hypothetical protein